MPRQAKDQPPHILAAQNNSLTHIRQPPKTSNNCHINHCTLPQQQTPQHFVNTSYPITICLGNNNEPRPRALIANQQNPSPIVATHQPSSTTTNQAATANLIFPITPSIYHNHRSHLTTTNNHSTPISPPIINIATTTDSIQCINLHARSPTTARQSSASTRCSLATSFIKASHHAFSISRVPPILAKREMKKKGTSFGYSLLFVVFYSSTNFATAFYS